MIRLLLSLLALISGLGLGTSLADARDFAPSGTEIGVSIGAAHRAMPARRAPIAVREAAPSRARPEPRRPAPRGNLLAIATVLPGIDRARE
jgi:hypothetical protein